MKTGLYAVQDILAGELFGSIIRATNHEVARRSFDDLLRQKDSPIANHKGDYNLYFLGTITSDGIIEPAAEPVAIMKGADWLEANKEA